MAGRRSYFAYWAAVAMAIACIAIVFPGSTLLRSKIESAGDSLVWLTGGAAIILILIHELLDSVADAPRRKKPRQHEGEIHTAEFRVGKAPDHQQAVSTSETRDRVTGTRR